MILVINQPSKRPNTIQTIYMGFKKEGIIRAIIAKNNPEYIDIVYISLFLENRYAAVIKKIIPKMIPKLFKSFLVVFIFFISSNMINF